MLEFLFGYVIGVLATSPLYKYIEEYIKPNAALAATISIMITIISTSIFTVFSTCFLACMKHNKYLSYWLMTNI